MMIRRIAVALLVLVGGLLGACSPPKSETLPPPTFSVDDSVAPAVPSLPGFDGTTPRPVASVTDAKGNQADFVANELWLSTDDDGVLSAFLARWQGEVLLSFDPAAYDLADLKPQYLVRVVVDAADVAKFQQHLRALDPHSRGEHRVSSDDGLKLLAAGASEAAAGLEVGVNWVGSGGSFRTRVTREAPTGPSGYSRNAFDWPFFKAGSVQDIGVTEAWRALEVAGKLNNRVKLAVLDMGFAPDEDFPAGWLAISNVPFKEPINTRNMLSCGGNPCPWHGTQVVGAAAGVPNNDYGAAGPAGPIADLIMVFTLYDFFTSMWALGAAKGAGARIANMSYGAPVPAALSWSVIPFDVATFGFRRSGMLLFAAAGNDGADVDATDCFIVCWEEAWHTPCENSGVICVGGLAWDSQNRASASNYGAYDVDIFAPFTVWVGPDPSSSGNYAQAKHGTSFASPYAAGVAALIWAARPGLSANQVANLLLTTAHTSPDSRVKRYVNAYAAVKAALGDAPPYIRITSPAPGSSHSRGFGIPFSADAEDLEGSVTVTWSSSRDGTLGTGLSLSRSNLSYGTHTITATARDSANQTRSDRVTITIVNDPPVVDLIEPINGARYCEGESVTFRATSFDRNLPPSYRLSDTQIHWRSDRDGALGTGHTLTRTLSVGTHTVTVRGTDDQGAFDEKSVGITVDVCVDHPPEVTIVTPPEDVLLFYDGYDEAKRMWYTDVALAGSATDPEDGDLTGASLVWRTNLSDVQDELLGTGASLTARLYSNVCQGVTHTVTLTASDSGGNSRTALRRISIYTIC